jgi:hypothetical protein
MQSLPIMEIQIPARRMCLTDRPVAANQGGDPAKLALFATVVWP